MKCSASECTRECATNLKTGKLYKQCDFCRERARLYRKRNKESVKQYNEQYRLDNKDAIKESSKQYRLVNNDAIKRYQNEYRAKNREKKNKILNQYYSTHNIIKGEMKFFDITDLTNPIELTNPVVNK